MFFNDVSNMDYLERSAKKKIKKNKNREGNAQNRERICNRERRGTEKRIGMIQEYNKKYMDNIQRNKNQIRRIFWV